MILCRTKIVENEKMGKMNERGNKQHRPINCKCSTKEGVEEQDERRRKTLFECGFYCASLMSLRESNCQVTRSIISFSVRPSKSSRQASQSSITGGFYSFPTKFQGSDLWLQVRLARLNCNSVQYSRKMKRRAAHLSTLSFELNRLKNKLVIKYKYTGTAVKLVC